jgi:hypothetical protein
MKKNLVDNIYKYLFKRRGFIICFIIIFLICLPFFCFHLSTDGYYIINGLLYSNNPLLSISGRPISDFIVFYNNLIGLNMNSHQLLFNVLSMFISFIAIIISYKLIKNITNNQNTSIFLILMSLTFVFFNPFGFELYLYNVAFSISIEYLLIIYSIKLLLESTNLKNCLIAIVLNFFGLCIYQGTSVLFVPLALILLNRKNINSQKDTDYWKDTFKIISIYAFSCLLNLIYLKMVPISRYTAPSGIISGIKSILLRQKFLWINTFGIIPNYIFLLLIMALIIIALFVILNSHKSKLFKKYNLITLVLFIISTIGLSFLPLVFSSILIVPRVVMIISALPGLLLLFILLNYNQKDNYYKNLNLIILLIVVVYSFILINSSSILVNGLKITNSIDQSEANKIQQTIENKSITDIKYLYFSPDKKVTWERVGNFWGMDTFIRALTAEWSRVALMNYSTGRNYENLNVENNSLEYKNKINEFNNYCLSQDWNEYNDSQIMIYKDTAFICNY